MANLSILFGHILQGVGTGVQNMGIELRNGHMAALDRQRRAEEIDTASRQQLKVLGLSQRFQGEQSELDRVERREDRRTRIEEFNITQEGVAKQGELTREHAEETQGRGFGQQLKVAKLQIDAAQLNHDRTLTSQQHSRLVSDLMNAYTTMQRRVREFAEERGHGEDWIADELDKQFGTLLEVARNVQDPDELEEFSNTVQNRPAARASEQARQQALLAIAAAGDNEDEVQRIVQQYIDQGGSEEDLLAGN